MVFFHQGCKYDYVLVFSMEGKCLNYYLRIK